MCILLASFAKVVAMDDSPSVGYNVYDVKKIKLLHKKEKIKGAENRWREYIRNKDNGNIKYTKNSRGGGGGVKRRLEYPDEGSPTAKETKANNN